MYDCFIPPKQLKLFVRLAMSQRLNKNAATRINFDIHNVLTINIKYMNK